MTSVSTLQDESPGLLVRVPAPPQRSSDSTAADVSSATNDESAEPAAFFTADNPLLPIVIGMAFVFGAGAALIAFAV